MRSIGVDVDEGLVYEGQSPYGRGVWPTPTLSIASIVSGQQIRDQITETNDLGLAQLIFREDSFDAVTRLRRGRIYIKIDYSQPHQWHVEPHPAWPNSAKSVSSGARFAVLLHGFAACPPAKTIEVPSTSLVALGTKSSYSLWRVVARERIVTGEDLFTLKACSALGLLPELNHEAIPPDAVTKVNQVFDALVEAAHTSGATSVIDRARDTCQWCLGVWLADLEKNVNLRQEDLGVLARKMEEKEHTIRGSIGKIIARLHSRGKPNEQQRYESRQILEEDGEFAIAATGLLLRELGWTK